MNVLFLTNVPSPYRVDFFTELAKYCTLTVLYESYTATDRDASWLSLEGEKTYQSICMKSVFQLSSSAFCPEILSYLKNRRADLVIVGVYSTPTGMYAIHYMKRHHIPYIISCDGGSPKNDRFLKKWLKKYFLSGAEGYLSTGNLCDSYLLTYGVARERIYRYPFTSIREKDIIIKIPAKEEKEKLRKQLGLPQGKKLILSVGQFIPRKGYDLLIQAAGILKRKYGDERAFFCIVGGSVLPEYQKWMAEENITQMQFLPFMQKERLLQYYRAADLFVLPTREDIWGLVINEAMANGLPVITTSACVAGMEMLSGSRHCIVDPENPTMLANAMSSFLESDTEWRQAGELNLEISKKFTIEEMALRHASIFKDILLKRGKKILFVGSQVPEEVEQTSRNISAAGNRFQHNLIRNMENCGYLVESVNYLGVPLENGIDFQTMNCAFWTGVYSGSGIRNKLRAMRMFGRLIRERLQDIDYVVCYNIHHAWLFLPLWARRRKIHSIAIVADFSPPGSFTGITRNLYARLMQKGFRQFDTVVGLSGNINNYLKSTQKFLLMEGGIDQALFRLFLDAAEPFNEKYTVLYAGLLDKVTGIDLLLEGMKRIPTSFPIQLWITGKGRMDSTVAEAAANDPRIVFLGYLPYENYLQALAKADVLINPRNMNLPENQNNFPSKILEYLCTGKPVLSTRFIGCEKFPHFLYCGSTAQEIAEGMMNAQHMLDRKQELCEQSRKIAENYLWEKQIQRMLN